MPQVRFVMRDATPAMAISLSQSLLDAYFHLQRQVQSLYAMLLAYEAAGRNVTVLTNYPCV